MILPTTYCYRKKHNKKEFRRAVRIEVARQKKIEKVNIMEAQSNNMELFHKLIQKNRKKGLEHIQDINVNGKTYSGSDEVLLGFQEHFRSLSTFDKSAHKEIRYHQQVEMENKYITEMSKEELILPVTEEEITTAIASINKRKSADFHSLTIKHILHAGENIITVLTHILNSIFLEGDIPEVLKIGLTYALRILGGRTPHTPPSKSA
jgi:hypothetical protein